MPRYSTYFPIPATAKFIVELPEGSTPAQIRQALLVEGQAQSCLCYQCNRNLEIDDSVILEESVEKEFDYGEE